MARLAAKARMGYYPLPEGIAHLIRSNLHFDHKDEYSAIDLFAGEGKALKLIAGEDCRTYGCELNAIRAELAKDNLDQVIHGAAEFVKIEGTLSLHYFNPPYDDGQGGRLEAKFLEVTGQHLTPGGLFIGVVPEHLLANYSFTSELTKYHTNIVVRRFPEPEFDVFSQVVIFAIGRSTPQGYSDYALTERLKSQARTGFPVLKAGEFKYTLPQGQIIKFSVDTPTLPTALIVFAHKALCKKS